MSKLTQYIELTLGEQSKFALPGLGTFRIDRLPARLDRAKGLIYPPTKQVRFNPGNAADDGILRRLYLTGDGTPEEQTQIAGERLRADMEEMVKVLETDAPVTIGHLGMLIRDPWQSGKITFRSDGGARGFDLPAVTLMLRDGAGSEGMEQEIRSASREPGTQENYPAEPAKGVSIIETPTLVTSPKPDTEASHTAQPIEEPSTSEAQTPMPPAEPTPEPVTEPHLTPTPSHPTSETTLQHERPRESKSKALQVIIGCLIGLMILGGIIFLITRGGKTAQQPQPQPTPAPTTQQAPATKPQAPVAKPITPQRETYKGLPIYRQGEITPRHYIIIASLMTDKEMETYLKSHKVHETFPDAGILMMRNGQRRIFSHALEDSDRALERMREIRKEREYSQSWIYLDK